MKLNLGSGGRTMPGWTSVDFHHQQADLKVDLFSFPWPWKDSSVDSVAMFHLLEHFENPVIAIKEVHRVLRPGGMFWVEVPHVQSVNAFILGHKSFFSRATFLQLAGVGETWFLWDRPALFREVRYRVKLIHHPLLKWTPFDWLASTFALSWEKFGFIRPTLIEWQGLAIK